MKLFALIPTARGISQHTMSCLWDGSVDVQNHGHTLGWSGVQGMVLDLARNELTAVFLSTTAEAAVCQDDDVYVEPEWYSKVTPILEELKIISFPVRMRSEGNMYNIIPLKAPEEIGGIRVVECAWTGFGCVLIHRSVFQKLVDDAIENDKRPPCPHCGKKELQSYRSLLKPEIITAAIFQSRVVAVRTFQSDAPPEENTYILDDRVFCLKAHAAGFRIWAAIDVPTAHRGITGCFGADLERMNRENMKPAGLGLSKLVQADGTPIRGKNDRPY